MRSEGLDVGIAQTVQHRSHRGAPALAFLIRVHHPHQVIGALRRKRSARAVLNRRPYLDGSGMYMTARAFCRE